MPAGPLERESQATFALHLRYAIDTARKYPTNKNRAEALELARSQPHALRSKHVRHNLGVSRWDWLTENGVYPIGEEGGIEGSFKGTITPDITT